jgi:annexin A7/11
MYYSSTNALTAHYLFINQGRPTLCAKAHFDASEDATLLYNAMKGIGTDEKTLINVLCKRSLPQRLEIAKAFKTAYGKDLIENIKSETSGNFRITLTQLLRSKFDFYAYELHDAIAGLGTREDSLIEIMCTLTNDEIRNTMSAYLRLFKKSLEDDLKGDTSGYFKRLMVALCAANRDESVTIDTVKSNKDAAKLKAAGVDRFGTNEVEFLSILCRNNFTQLRAICSEYEKLTGHTLEADIKKEFSGDIEDGLIAILNYARNPTEFFARRLHKSMVGFGTRDRALIRLCIMRCEIDMEDVKEDFQKLFKKTLKSFIQGDTSGKTYF